MIEYAPEPWSRGKPYSPDDPTVNFLLVDITDGEGSLVATVRYDMTDDESKERSIGVLRLLLATPSLYYACKALVRGDSLPERTTMADAIRQAKAAIAKAEGRADG